MRKPKFIFLIIAIIGIIVSSCKKQKQEDIFTMSFKVDNSGESFSAKAGALKISDTIDVNNSQIWIRGKAKDSIIVMITIRTLIEANKTYSFGSPHLTATFIAGNSVLLSNFYFAKTGTLKITSFSGREAEGTFEFTAENSLNESRAITDGKFKVKIEELQDPSLLDLRTGLPYYR